jgi:hypothetical protein
MKSLSKNNIVLAFVALMLFSAAIHMVVLVAYFLKTGDFSLFNFFSITELDLFLPTDKSGVLSDVLSAVTSLLLFVLFYTLIRKSKR